MNSVITDYADNIHVSLSIWFHCLDVPKCVCEHDCKTDGSVFASMTTLFQGDNHMQQCIVFNMSGNSRHITSITSYCIILFWEQEQRIHNSIPNYNPTSTCRPESSLTLPTRAKNIEPLLGMFIDTSWSNWELVFRQGKQMISLNWPPPAAIGLRHASYCLWEYLSLPTINYPTHSQNCYHLNSNLTHNQSVSIY